MKRQLDAKQTVEFLFHGCLGSHWQSVFDGFELTDDGQNTRAVGVVADQAALFGLLKHIRDLNLTLVAFRYLD